MKSVLSSRTVIGLVAGTMLTSSLVIASAIPSAPKADAASGSVFCDDPRAGAPITSPPLQSYTPITPVRLLDTRNNIAGLSTQLEAGCTIRLSVGTDVPAGAQAIALSLTADSAVSDFITVYPCALGRPESSNLNYRAGTATANLVVAIPDANRQVCIYSHGRTHVIADLEGWWSDGPNRFASVPPQRVYDSRRPGFARLDPDQPREIVMPTSVVPANATSVMINLTTTNSTAFGFFTAYPCGSPVPNASNLNFAAGEDRAVAAIVGLGAGQKVCVVSNVPSNVVIDVNGYYAPAPQFGPTAALQPTSGTRIVDTRNAIGGPRQKYSAFEVRAYDPVAGQSGAAEASAVTLNVISSGATADGFVTIYPCGGAVPDVSSLNYRAGQIASNLATIELAGDRTICVQATTPTDIIIDVYGMMRAPAGSLAERITFDRNVFPPFNPAAQDYAIKCPAAGANSVNIGLELLPGTSATLDGPLAAVGNGTTNRVLQTDQLMTLTLTRGGQQSAYHFRCLPADFPDLSVERPGQPAPGWYLTTFGANGSPGGPFSVIFDEYGAPVWYKRVKAPVGDFKRLSNGDLAYIAASTPFGTSSNAGYWITRIDGTFVRTDRTTTPATLPVDHHDYVDIGGGGRAMVSYPTDRSADLTSLNPPVDNGPVPGAGNYTSNQIYADNVIQEISSGGSQTWLWRMSDHIPADESTYPMRFPFMSPAVDVYHVNSIDRQTNGDYVVSARHLDAVFRVNHDGGGVDGDIEWVLGGAPSTPGRLCAASTSQVGKCLRIIGDPLNGPKRPHDARMVGDILTMMDNRTDDPAPSRAVGYRIDTSNPADPTATMVWEIRNRSSQTGNTLGSVRQQPDGSILIGWGEPIQSMHDEYAANGTRLMSIGQSPFGYSYRIVKYPKTDFDLVTLRANAGGPAVGPP